MAHKLGLLIRSEGGCLSFSFFFFFAFTLVLFTGYERCRWVSNRNLPLSVRWIRLSSTLTTVSTDLSVRWSPDDKSWPMCPFGRDWRWVSSSRSDHHHHLLLSEDGVGLENGTEESSSSSSSSTGFKVSNGDVSSVSLSSEFATEGQWVNFGAIFIVIEVVGKSPRCSKSQFVSSQRKFRSLRR
jgi:hypothetical protein